MHNSTSTLQLLPRKPRCSFTIDNQMYCHGIMRCVCITNIPCCGPLPSLRASYSRYKVCGINRQTVFAGDVLTQPVRHAGNCCKHQRGVLSVRSYSISLLTTTRKKTRTVCQDSFSQCHSISGNNFPRYI